VKPVKILWVEDGPSDIYLVKKYLRECPFPVELVVAQDGAAAISMIEGSNFKVDLIILDLDIPKETAMQSSKKLAPRVRLIVVFATRVMDADRVVALGAREVVQKPIQLRPFIQTFCSIVEKWARPREN
jgi:CheY-like chemotaxis protein